MFKYLFFPCVLLLGACSSGGSGGAESGSSSSSGGSSEGAGSSSSSSSSGGGASAGGSHNAGLNCTQSSCHDGNSNAERFYAAGTIYRSGGQPQTNATVYLYVAGSNEVSATMTTDASGNIYTTEPVKDLYVAGGPLVNGNDVEVHGPGGIRTMPGIISSGSCNGCHYSGTRDGVAGNGPIVVN